MKGYFIFLLLVIICYYFAEYTRKKGFENLTINRSCKNNMIFPGEEFKIVTTIENNKWFPISFLHLQEEYPLEVERASGDKTTTSLSMTSYNSSYTILWYERVKRAHTAIIKNRGVYFLKEIHMTLGDIFGFSSDKRTEEDFLEIVVYPKFTSIDNLIFQNNSIQGDIIVKRWIFKDPLYIRGIREYCIEDRMKDIHWNSSLKMGNLMVKEYDHTSERELVFIVNVQCAKPYWGLIDRDAIERSIKVAVSMAKGTIDQGIPTGMMTNAQIITYSGKFPSEIPTGSNNFKAILELGARIDKTPRVELDEYLREKGKSFNKNAIYVIVTSYLNEDIIDNMIKLRRSGINLKIIDTSKDMNLPEVEQIEKLIYKGEGQK